MRQGVHLPPAAAILTPSAFHSWNSPPAPLSGGKPKPWTRFVMVRPWGVWNLFLSPTFSPPTYPCSNHQLTCLKREVTYVLIIYKSSQAGRGRGLAALAAVGFGEGQNPKGCSFRGRVLNDAGGFSLFWGQSNNGMRGISPFVKRLYFPSCLHIRIALTNLFLFYFSQKGSMGVNLS